MSDRFQRISMEQLAEWIFTELRTKNSIFGIPREHFFVPKKTDRFHLEKYHHQLDTPIGVASGPHSQMAQNIVVAWLCGARFMELKTVQTLDELEVSKPCIDIEDEGYNVEWSQELKVHESYDEYLRAWVLLHALHRKLGFPGESPGIIFNTSVGYNLEGLMQPNMQWYLRKVADTSEELGQCIQTVARFCPEVKDVDIPAKMSDSLTLSTMHGCPPDEIERISSYVMKEWSMHTSVKCNPTLLGPGLVRKILNDELRYKDVVVPDAAFAHDLKYADAVPMLHNLSKVAKQKNLIFGVKLSNTLEVENFRTVFAASEKMMYLSGRPLHALTVNLANVLAEEFKGDLLMSFAGGVDAVTAPHLIRCGMKTVTTCSDILKPGGYMRMLQYLENIDQAMKDVEATDISDYVCKSAKKQKNCGDLAAMTAGSSPDDQTKACARINLRQYAQYVRSDRLLMKGTFRTSRSKTTRKLGLFDCIEAPCTDECPIDQKVPLYMEAVREGRFDDAIKITREDNPVPTILGRACDHLCENTCIRTHYDEPLAIREMKRFIMEHEKAPAQPRQSPPNGIKVGIIGAGPAGLSIAYFLAQAGYAVRIYEEYPYAGGMVAGTIPAYRLPDPLIVQDVSLVEKLGVEIRYNHKAGRDFVLSDLQKEGFKHIAIATGAQVGKKLGIEGDDSEGIMQALYFLRNSREGHPVALGKHVGIIGAGDSAMDCARSAWRLSKDGKISVIYRRTIEEMPADRVEVQGLIEEGIEIVELARPHRIFAEGGKLKALECIRCKLGPRDASGRKPPVDIPGSNFQIPLDNLILAISQSSIFDFFDKEKVELTAKGYIKVDPVTLETSIPNVYAAGDASGDGPASIVKAAGGGRRVVAAIRRKEEKLIDGRFASPEVNVVDLIRRRARREFRVPVPMRSLEDRRNFKDIILTLSEADAKKEAGRCLDCHKMCSICVGVCPNLAIMTYKTAPFEARLPDLKVSGGRLARSLGRTFRVDQQFQIAILTDFCNECGDCATFCPTAGRPYKDKPRLYLTRREFEREKDNAFMVFHDGSVWAMQAKFGSATHDIVWNGDLRYNSPKVRATLDPDTFDLKTADMGPACAEGDAVSLDECANMYVLLRGLRDSMSHMPTATIDEAAPLVQAAKA